MRVFALGLLVALSLAVGSAVASDRIVARHGSTVIVIKQRGDGSAPFQLSAGVLPGETSCREDWVDCLTVEGTAYEDGDTLEFSDEDLDGHFVVVPTNSGFKLADVYGGFGAGRDNAFRVDEIAGTYRVVTAPAVAASEPDVMLVTPSGNIQCLVSGEEGDSLRCDVTNIVPSAGPPPASCEDYWGDAFLLGAWGRPKVLCHDDWLSAEESMVLGYGESMNYGQFTCWSERTGLTCQNQNGHGFTLSRMSQSFY